MAERERLLEISQRLITGSRFVRVRAAPSEKTRMFLGIGRACTGSGVPNKRAAKEAQLASSVTVLKKKKTKPISRQSHSTGTGHVCPVEQNVLKGSSASHPTLNSLQKLQLSSHLSQQPQNQAGWGLGQGQQPPQAQIKQIKNPKNDMG